MVEQAQSIVTSWQNTKRMDFTILKDLKQKASPSMVRSTTLAQEKRSVRMAVLSVVS